MHRVIMEGADATTLHITARRQGMITLYEDGLRKVVQGLTSLEEVMRITGPEPGRRSARGAVAAMPAPGMPSPDAGFFLQSRRPGWQGPAGGDRGRRPRSGDTPVARPRTDLKIQEVMVRSRQSHPRARRYCP